MKRSIYSLAISAIFAVSLSAAAQAAEMEVKVPFAQLPDSVQSRLVGEVGNMNAVSTANVWIGSINGKTVYTGRIVGWDGSVQTINVDADGNLIEARKFPGPLLFQGR